MKTIQLFIAVAAAAFALVACSEIGPVATADEGDTISVIVSAGLPNTIGTKAYGTGANAQYLTYGVYDDDMTLVVEGERYLAFTDGSLSASFTVDLVRNQNYTLVFWADGGESSYYDVDLSEKTVSVNYSEDESSYSADGNIEDRDAFYACESYCSATDGQSLSVTLNRPVAQLNFGTNDLDDSALENAGVSAEDLTFSVTVVDVPTELNLLSGQVSGSCTVTFSATGVPSDSDFPVLGYEMVSMNYVLVGTEDEPSQVISEVVMDITASVISDIQISVNNVPLAQNYRTNIYGSLLTNPADLNISLGDWAEEDENIEYPNYSLSDEVIDAIGLTALSAIAEQLGIPIDELTEEDLADMTVLDLSTTDIVSTDLSSLTSLETLIFTDCTTLESITLPSSLLTISSNAFSGCTSLETVSFASSSSSSSSSRRKAARVATKADDSPRLTSVGDSAFFNCTSLKYIDLPSSVDSLGVRAFAACSALESIELPDGITYIGNSAFNSCSSLESIELPDGVTYLGNRCFLNCTALKSCKLPESLTEILLYTFYGCTGLESIRIPAAITTINNYSFYNCTSLSSLTFAEDSQLTMLGFASFYLCTSLTEVVLPDSLTELRGSAFQKCSSLTTVTIPASVTAILSYTFTQTNITYLYCKGTTPPTLSATPSSGVNGAFYGHNFANGAIYVPTDCVSTYQSANYWSTFSSYFQAYEFD